MEQFELDRIFEDTLTHTEQNEEVRKALSRRVYSDQNEISVAIKKGDFEATIRQVRTKKFVDEHSDTVKEIKKTVDQYKHREKLMVKTVKGFNSKLDELTESTKSIASGIETLTQGMQFLGSMACLNVALSAAGLCATLVTFEIMNKKLDSIQCGINDINRKLDQIMQAKEIDTAIDVKQLIIKYKKMLDKEEKGQKLSREEYGELLENVYLQDSKLIDYYLYNVTNNPDELLAAIYLLAGMLAQLVKRYDEAYYFAFKNEESNVDPNHETWMSVFEVLSSKQFLNVISDRCFFENSLSNRKTQEIVTGLYFSQIKNIVMIEDNNLIIRQCDSPEELAALKRKEYELAYKDLNSQIEEYYENLEGEPVVSKEEMDRETRKAAIKLGYITE